MSSVKNVEWLRGEAGAWVKDGILSEQQAAAVLARYPAPGARLPWGAIIFSTIGAVAVGLGVILLFAYNWNAMPKAVKMALVLGSLAAAHAAGIRHRLGSVRFRGLGEGLCVLGTMLFGAAIWLVAQIYHIDEHFPNGIMMWGLGALLMALAMQSTPQAIIAAVLLAAWSGAETVGFGATVAGAPLLILLTLLPMAWIRKSLTLLAVAVPAFLASLLIPLLAHFHHPWFVIALFMNISGTLVGLSILVRSMGGFPRSSAVFGSIGWALFIALLYLASFPGICAELFGHRGSIGAPNGTMLACVLVSLIPCVAAWAEVLYRRAFSRGKAEGGEGFEIYLVPLTVILAYAGMFFSMGFKAGWLMALTFNMVFLALAFSMMVRGCRNGLLKPTMFGSVMLVAIMFARYFDLFDSLAIRGLVFVVVGAGIFLEGIIYARARKQKKIAVAK